MTNKSWIGDPSAGPYAVYQAAMTNLPPGAVMKSLISTGMMGKEEIKVAFGLAGDSIKSMMAIQDGIVIPVPSQINEVEAKLKQALDEFVKLYALGPGIGSARVVERGKVFRIVSNQVGYRLGNVRDIGTGVYGASYRGPLGKPVVFKREFKTVSRALMLIALYHDLLATAEACSVVGYTEGWSDLLGAASDLRQGKPVPVTVTDKLAQVIHLGSINEYLQAIVITARTLDPVMMVKPVPLAESKPLSELLSPKLSEPAKPEPRPFQVHYVEATDRFLAPYRAWQVKLRAAIESGIQSEETPPVTGNGPGVRIVTFNDGFKAVRKVMNKHDCLDHECVASLVGNALDPGRAHVIVPYALRTALDSVYLELLDGVASKLYTYDAVLVPGDCSCCSVPKRLARHDLICRGGAIFMSALDVVIGNTDRHCDNLLLHDDGRWRLIDHAYSLDLEKFKDLDTLEVRELRLEIDDQTLDEWHARVTALTEEIRDVTLVRGVDLAVQVSDRILEYRKLAAI